MSPSPVTSPSDASSSSAQEKEAAIEAKIARIRARNRQLLRRHQEVEEDRREAEQADSALGRRQAGDDWREGGAFQNPFRPGAPPPRGPLRDGAAGSPEGTRGGWRGKAAPPAGGVKQRLGEREAPPRDPVNNYRDGDDSSQHGQLRRPLRGRGRGTFVPGRGRGGVSEVPGEFPQGRVWEGGRGKRRDEENVSPRRPFSDPKEFSPRPTSASSRGFRNGGNGAVPRPPRASAQDRLFKARAVQDNQDNRRVLGSGENLTVKVAFDRTSDPESPQHRLPTETSDQAARAELPEDDWDERGESTRPSGSSGQSQEAPEENQSPEHYQRQASNDWLNAPNIEDWSEEVSKEMPSPEAAVNMGQYDWGYQQYATSAPAMEVQQQQLMHTTPVYYDPHQGAPVAGYVPFQAGDTAYLPSMVHHPQQQALTQVSHGPHHNVPIMTSQPLVQGVMQPHQPHAVQQSFMGQQPPPHEFQSRGYSNPYMGGPPPRRNFDQQSFFDGGSGRGRGRGWFDREPPTKEITRIPSKFQKQRLPKVAAKPVSRHQLPADLLVATPGVALDKCRRLTFLATSDVSSLIQKLSNKLGGTDARHLSVSTVGGLFEKVSQVSTTDDRVVVIHAGAAEAADIAAKAGLSDLEKGAESDAEADAICDLAEDLIRRIPHLNVFVSTLCPRFDVAKGNAVAGANGGAVTGGMSLPNSVRRVMNVQLSMRLHGYKKEGKIQILNNDEVLDCFEDDAKRAKLFGTEGDGVTLTEEGEKILLNHWIASIKPIVKDIPAKPDNVDLLTSKVEAVTVTNSTDVFEDAVELSEKVQGHGGTSCLDRGEKTDSSTSVLKEADPDDQSSLKSEIREKENDEKMEKDL